MARRKLVNKNTRNVNKGKSGSYAVTLPMEMVKKLGWQDRQKVVFVLRGKTIVIKDWSK